MALPVSVPTLDSRNELLTPDPGASKRPCVVTQSVTYLIGNRKFTKCPLYHPILSTGNVIWS